MTAAWAMWVGMGGLLSAAVPGRPVEGRLFYTSFFDQPRTLLMAEFRFDGAEATLGAPQVFAELPGLPDGIVLLPEEGLAVGCGSTIAVVNPWDASVTSVSSGIEDAYHVMLDPSGRSVWSANGLGLAQIPVSPLGEGSVVKLQEGSVVPESVAWLGSKEAYFAADGVLGRLVLPDLEDPFTETLEEFLLGGPALIADPWTGDLFHAGGRRLVQLRVVSGEPRPVSLRTLPPEVDLDHIHVDGQGHFWGANARGSIFFIDYSATGLIGSSNCVVKEISVPQVPGGIGRGSVDGIAFVPRGYGLGGGGGGTGGGGGGGEPPKPDLDPPEGLLHWWPGDGSGEDVIGEKTLASTAKPSFRPGVSGPAFFQTRPEHWWQAAPDREWDLSQREFTFSVWAWFEDAGVEGSLLGNFIPRSAGNHGRWSWDVQDRRLRFFHSRGAGSTGNSIVGPTFDPLGRRWYHLALTRRGAEYRFFINGRLRGSATNAAVIPPEPGPLIMGSLSPGSRMDEVQWYDRALAADEVAGLYFHRERYRKRPQITLESVRDALRCRILGGVGGRVRLEGSADLQKWTPVEQSELAATEAGLLLPMNPSGGIRFLRAVTQGATTGP